MSKHLRWDRNEEDSARLPEGMKRVGYDTDTSQYTFLDRKGTLYKSESGSHYGKLRPIKDPNEILSKERPGAFENNGSSRGTPYSPKTFAEFLPPEMMTVPASGPDDPRPSGFSHRRSKSSPPKHVEFKERSPADKVRSVSRLSAVVQGLKRSVTSSSKDKSKSRKRSKSDSRHDDGGYAPLYDPEGSKSRD